MSTLDWASDSRRLGLEKRHAEKMLVRLLRAAHVSNSRWAWESDSKGTDDSSRLEDERERDDEVEHRLCLYRNAGASPVCDAVDESLLIDAASGDAHAEWRLEDRLRYLVARARETR